MYKLFITGTNSGIGLEFVRQYAQDNFQVFASYLKKANTQELETLAKTHKNITLIPLDVTNEQDIAAVANQLKNETIDILINNAGIWGTQNDQDLEHITIENMMQTFLVNAVGPLMVSKHFVPHVARSALKKIVTISSTIGSITNNKKGALHSGDSYAYRASKTAVNSIMKSFSIDVYDKGIKILLVHPGWVKTAIGGQGAQITTQQSVQGMRNVIMNQPITLEQFYYTYEGNPLSW